MRTRLLLLLILIAFFLKPFKSAAQVSVQDSLALVNLYDSTNGANWTNKTNWLSHSPVSSWYGVMVYGGRVYTLTLNHNNLVGTIPYSLGVLGTLSDYFIHLDLSYNQLSGSVPSSFKYLVDLSVLYLNNNHLSGDLSNSLASNPHIGYFEKNIANNLFTFAGIEAIVNAGVMDTTSVYAPQAKIPINKQGSTLSVSAGGTLTNDTFSLYKNGVLNVTQIGDSTFAVTTGGNYSVSVTNAVAKKLTLYSDTITVDSISVSLCPTLNDTTLRSSLTGTTYQWQINTGTGFTNVNNIDPHYAGVKDSVLYLSAIPSSSYGTQFRCLVDGNYSNVFTLKVTDTWTGAIDSTWGKGGNWSCGLMPNADTDVIINSGTVVLNSTTSVRSIAVSPNASFTIKTGKNLTVLH